jgi:hypothetical protein
LTCRQILTGLTLIALAAPGWAKKKPEPDNALRWQPSCPVCSVDHSGSENLDRYTISGHDLVVSLGVDPRELVQSQKRAGRVVGVLLTVETKGAAPMLVKQSDASLEFVVHSQWRFSSWDPDNLVDHIQHQTDDLMHQTDKDLEKKPEKVEKNEDRLREQQRLVSETVDFLGTQSLRDTTLDAGHPKVSGWVFFPSRGKWVGDWKKREQFIFRIPVGPWVVEFPFVLPPEIRPKLKERPD